MIFLISNRSLSKGRNSGTIIKIVGSIMTGIAAFRVAGFGGRGRGADMSKSRVQSGIQFIDDIFLIDQSPKGRNGLGLLSPDVWDFAFIAEALDEVHHETRICFRVVEVVRFASPHIQLLTSGQIIEVGLMQILFEVGQLGDGQGAKSLRAYALIP